jgi:hypothetical protein
MPVDDVVALYRYQKSILADQHSIAFYASLGFVRAGRTDPMWIYHAKED